MRVLRVYSAKEDVNEQQQSTVRRKRLQRSFEYALLIGFQGFMAGSLMAYLHPFWALFSAVLFGATAWMLTQRRERRRALQSLHRTKLLGDIAESVFVLLLFSAYGLVAIAVAAVPESVLPHLSVCVFSFIFTTAIAEYKWFGGFFATLSDEQQQQYIDNLSPSVIFPYNLRLLRSVFFRRPRT